MVSVRKPTKRTYNSTTYSCRVFVRFHLPLSELCLLWPVATSLKIHIGHSHSKTLLPKNRIPQTIPNQIWVVLIPKSLKDLTFQSSMVLNVSFLDPERYFVYLWAFAPKPIQASHNPLTQVLPKLSEIHALTDHCNDIWHSTINAEYNGQSHPRIRNLKSGPTQF